MQLIAEQAPASLYEGFLDSRWSAFRNADALRALRGRLGTPVNQAAKTPQALFFRSPHHLALASQVWLGVATLNRRFFAPLPQLTEKLRCWLARHRSASTGPLGC